VVVYSSCNLYMQSKSKDVDVQLQQGEVGVAVVRLVLALLHNIVLEDARGLGVVTVEAIEDLLYVVWPLGRKVVGCSHGWWWIARGLVLKSFVNFAQCGHPGASTSHSSAT
jgi:hypothetical protein